jgi:hypothetical protein
VPIADTCSYTYCDSRKYPDGDASCNAHCNARIIAYRNSFYHAYRIARCDSYCDAHGNTYPANPVG